MFADRRGAGRRLADRIGRLDWSDPVVLGLARGGVPVAAAVADALGAPLRVVVARKIGAPGNPELGVGAVTPDGPPYYDERVLHALGLRPRDLGPACEQERAEARRRVSRYHGGYDAAMLRGRDVLVVDDGLATGVTAHAALRAVREAAPRRLVFAAPVCAPDSAATLRDTADGVICVAAPDGFRAVGQWYEDFAQTTYDEVVSIIMAARSA